MTKFAIPVRFSVTKTLLIDAEDLDAAKKKAEEMASAVEHDTLYPFSGVSHALLMPSMMVPEDQLDKWPYWAYGWHGTDGVDWRQYRTDKGRDGIPDIAEESYPIPPYGEE